MKIDNRPGGPDGPPRKTPTWVPFVGIPVVAIPVLLVLVAMLWGIAWLIVNFPS